MKTEELRIGQHLVYSSHLHSFMITAGADGLSHGLLSALCRPDNQQVTEKLMELDKWLEMSLPKSDIQVAISIEAELYGAVYPFLASHNPDFLLDQEHYF